MYLYQIAGKPIWTPSFMTISQLFENQTSLKIADTLTLVTWLYQIYQTESTHPESFDAFYLWGELLLNDFDEVDKNLTDASKLFRTIQEQSAYIDTFEHLTDEQITAINHFLGQFDPARKSILKERFVENWNILLRVYTLFKERLQLEGCAYEGMLERQVIEQLNESKIADLPFKKYVFIGFNYLTRCEESFFETLYRADKALFYWDYDLFYLDMPEHEAGRFIRQNLQHFPNELSSDLFDTFRQLPKKIRFVATSTEDAATRLIPHWLTNLADTHHQSEMNEWEKTAIVLCHEQLLLPALHSIPDNVEELNVTMGYPLIQTPVANLILQLCQLHLSGKTKEDPSCYLYRYVIPLLHHPLVRMISQNAGTLTADLTNGHQFRPSISSLCRDEALKLLFWPTETVIELAERLQAIITYLATFQQPVDTQETTAPNYIDPDEVMIMQIRCCIVTFYMLYSFIPPLTFSDINLNGLPYFCYATKNALTSTIPSQ
jgi:hypothetical protein